MSNCKKNCVCFTALTFILIVILVFPSQSRADFPNRPINLIVIFAPGGIVDLQARAIAKAGEKHLGQSVVVQNKPGGGGSVGLGFVAKAVPDGYTIGTSIVGALTISPQMREVAYKLSDFVPIVGYSTSVLAICVKSDSPWNTYEEFIDYAKKNPGAISYGTSGTGTGNHLAMEWIGKKHGIKWTHIPYSGGIPAITALLGGHIQAVHATSEFLPYVESGKLKMLLVTMGRRFEKFPNVPDIREKESGFYVKSINGLVAPREVPKPILQKLGTTFKKATEDDGFIQVCKNLGMIPTYFSGEECTKIYKEAFEENTSLLKELGFYMKKPE